MPPLLSPVTLARLRAVSTCDVSDALQRLGRSQQWMPDILMVSGESKIIGPAHTVKFVGIEDEKAPKISPTYAHW
jgi:hypothetical protein